MSKKLMIYDVHNLTNYSLEISNRNMDINYYSNQIELLPWDALILKNKLC